MKRSTKRLALAFATMSMLGCGASQPTPSLAPTTTTTTAGSYATLGVGDDGVVTNPSALDDGQTLAAIRAAGRSVLEQSRQAVKKGGRAAVRELARDILDAYGQLAGRLDAVTKESGLTPVEGPMSAEVRRRGDELTARLARSARGDASFDRSYVEGQLDEAARLVDLIDRADAQTQSVDLQAFFTEIRARLGEERRAAEGVHAEIAK
jgi:predicted outer membrane protein